MITSMPLATMTLRGLLDRRRTWVLVLLAAVPVVTALLITLFGAEEALDEEIFEELIVLIVLPLIALVFGTGALGAELDDGTIVYLLTKPIRRSRIVLAKSVIAAGLTAALMVPATLLTGLLISIDDPSIMDATVAYAVAVLVGGTAYVIGFLALSTFTSRALAIGLAYVLIWEGILTGLFEALRFLSVSAATVGLAEAIQGVSRGATLDGTASLIVLGAFIVVGLVLGSWRLSRYQVRGGD